MNQDKSISFYFDPTEEGAFERLQVRNIDCAHKLGIDSVPTNLLRQVFETALGFKDGEAFSHFSGFEYKNGNGHATLGFVYDN